MEIGYLKTKSGMILWNVRKMVADIRKSPKAYELRAMPLVDLLGQCPPAEDYDMDCDINQAPVVLSLAPDCYRVVWGEAQINKASALGFWDIHCYFLKPGQHKKYIIELDEALYNRVVCEFQDLLNSGEQ